MGGNVSVMPGQERYRSTVFHASLTEAVESTIVALQDELTEKDAGIVTLIRTYAATMDRVLRDPAADAAARSKAVFIGPQLLKALESIGGTPQSRGELQPEAEAPAVDPVESLLEGYGSPIPKRARKKA